MNLRIEIVDNVCAWLGTTPPEMLAAPVEILSTSKIKIKARLSPEQKAWAMICHYFTSDKLRDLRLSDESVAGFFSASEDQVEIGKNQHAFLICSSISYKIVLTKIDALIETHLNKLYELTEQ